MEKENRNDFLSSLEESLKEDLNNLEIENKKNQENYQKKITELVKKQLAEAEKETEQKLKILYYWLFGTISIFLMIIIGMFLYLRKSLVR